MKHLTDIEIAQSKKLVNIKKIARKLNIDEDDLELYGKYKAKLPLSIIDEEKVKENNLILVTAMTPTPAGEGKTTVSIGLTEGLNKLNKQATVVIRSSFGNERWGSRRRLFSGFTNGRYQPSFYR